jgi:hypothetical protein
MGEGGLGGEGPLNMSLTFSGQGHAQACSLEVSNVRLKF